MHNRFACQTTSGSGAVDADVATTERLPHHIRCILVNRGTDWHIHDTLHSALCMQQLHLV